MISLLIKPASSSCNIGCKYCFYKSTCKEKEEESHGIMSLDILEKIIKKAYQDAENYCAFSFQGGEPTLVGISFFEKVIEFEKKYNKKGIKTMNSIQTNGILIDEDWAKFFVENNFLVGLSIDGPKELHDLNRVDYDNKGTFDRVMNAKKLFDKYNVEYNVLSVITSATVEKTNDLYKFYKENNIDFVQLIPCLDEGFNQKNENSSLKQSEYAKILKDIFDIWYEDYKKGEQVSIRLFENICAVILGYEAESCEMRGYCSVQNVIEANGDIYPCDFYVSDDKRIGNIKDIRFKNVMKQKKAISFVKERLVVNEKCKTCKYGVLCKGGCKRYRVEGSTEYYFCDTFTDFYDYTVERFIKVCQDIKQREE